MSVTPLCAIILNFPYNDELYASFIKHGANVRHETVSKAIEYVENELATHNSLRREHGNDIIALINQIKTQLRDGETISTSVALEVIQPMNSLLQNTQEDNFNKNQLPEISTATLFKTGVLLGKLVVKPSIHCLGNFI